MTYWNLIERYGPDAFARDLAAAGGAGAITPDLTPDEAAEWLAVSDTHGLDRIFLVSPSSTDERLASTVAACRGWVYATSVMGVTGARAQSSTAAPELVRRLRDIEPAARIGVGLGVSDGAQAAEITSYADAAIVGSALVATLLEAEDRGDPADLTGLRAQGRRSGRRGAVRPRRAGNFRALRRVGGGVTRTAYGRMSIAFVDDPAARAGDGDRLLRPHPARRDRTRPTRTAIWPGRRCPTRTSCPTRR